MEYLDIWRSAQAMISAHGDDAAIQVTHSIAATDANFSTFSFIKRNVGNGLSTSTLSFTLAEMKQHFNEVNTAAHVLEKLSGITESDRDAYLNAAKTAK